MEGQIVERARFTSSKITGAGDVDRLEQDLAAVDGVRDVEVDPNAHAVEVTYDPTVVNEPRLREALEDAGYGVDTGASSTTQS